MHVIMILGVLSDSHGQVQRTRRALRLLEDLGAQAFVHCGDVCGEEVLDLLAGRRAWFVWGNMDYPDGSVLEYVQMLGLPRPERIPLELHLSGRTVHVYHGHEPQFARLRSLLRAGDIDNLSRATARADYVLFGHTHVAAVEQIGPVRLVNPGALHRARPHTVATIDLQRDLVQHWTVDENAPESVPAPWPIRPR